MVGALIGTFKTQFGDVFRRGLTYSIPVASFVDYFAFEKHCFSFHSDLLKGESVNRGMQKGAVLKSQVFFFFFNEF